MQLGMVGLGKMGANMTRRLVRGVVLEDAAELLRLVGDDADRLPAEARQAGDDRLRELRLDIEDLAAVGDLPDYVVHVVGVPR